MEQIVNRHIPIHGSVRANEVVGKKVLARSGKKIGSVDTIYIDPQSLSIIGIKVNKGLLGVDQFIGSEYIKTMNDKGTVLNITPATEYLGMKVFDSRGKEIGKIKEVRRQGKTNVITSIVVDRGLLKKDLLLDRESIEIVGDGVMLNETIRDSEMKETPLGYEA